MSFFAAGGMFATPSGAVETTTPSSTKIARLYYAYFDREADPSGLEYWVNAHDYGDVDLDQISQFFAESHEFETAYGDIENSRFVSLVYHNVMKRTPDRQGYDYWIQQLDSGRLTRGKLMNLFAQSIEFSNKIDRTIVTYDGSTIPSVNHQDTRPELYWPCRTDYSPSNCKITDGNKKVLMVGDSFSARLFPTIYELAIENNWELHFLVTEGCPWAIGVSRDGHGECTESKWKVFDTIGRTKPELTIYTNFPYEKHGDSSRLSGQWPLPPGQFSDVVDATTGELLTEQQFTDHMTTAAQWTRDTTGGEVVIIEPAPIISAFDGMRCAQAATTWDECNFTMVNYSTDTQRQVRQFAANQDDIYYTSFNHWFCNGPDCVGVINGHSLLEDSIHINSQVLLGHKSQVLENLRATGANL